MEAVRSAAAAVCFLGTAFSIIGCFLPAEKFKSEFKLIFSLMMIVIIAKPFVSGDIDLKDANASAVQTQADIDDSVRYGEELLRQSVCANISENIERLCAEKNIAVQISSNVNISEDGSISINRIDIQASDESSALAAEKLIRSEIPGEYEITAGVELHHE